MDVDGSNYREENYYKKEGRKSRNKSRNNLMNKNNHTKQTKLLQEFDK